MKLRVDEDYSLVITEAFGGDWLETEEGDRLGFAMRDDTVELIVLPKGADRARIYRVNMQDQSIREMGVPA